MRNKSLTRMLITTTIALLVFYIGSCSSSPEDLDGNGGGIGGSGIAQGEITGFGSIFINNFRYDTDNAVISNSGVVSDLSSLRIGMHVRADVNFDSSVASRIVYHPIALGPIDSIDTLRSTVTVFDRSYFIRSDAPADGLSFESFNVGEIVEISGVRDGAGGLSASFVRSAESAESFFLQTVIEETRNETAVTVNGEVVSTTNLRPEISDALSPGDTLVLRIPRDSFNAANPLGNSVSISTIEKELGFKEQSFRIEGFVTKYSPITGFFEIGDYTFDLEDTTSVIRPDGSSAFESDFGTGSRVIVSGVDSLIGIIDVTEIIILEP